MMQYLAYIALGFVAFQLINVLMNFVFRQKIHKSTLPIKEPISVLIPARNEAHNIGFLLDDLSQIKSTKLEIIVYDDESEDNTAKIVKAYADRDKRIKLIQSDGLPNGWLGKNHACYQLAQHAKGNYYLFVDADVRLKGSVVEDTIFFLEKYKLGLLSIFPIQIQKTLGERLTVPIMNYILLSLLPLVFVRISPFSSHAAANGQFMLFAAKTYNKFQPHEIFRTSAVEDIAISTFFKKQNVKIACLTGDVRVKCRMYKSYRESFNGFSKNVFMFFGNKPLFAFLFWTLATLGFIPVLLSSPNYLLIYLVGIILTQILYSITSKQNFFLNSLFYPVHLVFILQVMVNGLRVKKRKKYLWKERNIYL